MILKKAYNILHIPSSILCLSIIFTCQAMDPPSLADQTATASSKDSTEDRVTTPTSGQLETILDWLINKDNWRRNNSFIHRLHRPFINEKLESMKEIGETGNSASTPTQFPKTLNFSGDDDKLDPTTPEFVIHNCGHFFPPDSINVSAFFAILGDEEASKSTLVIDYLDRNDFQKKTKSKFKFDTGYVPDDKEYYNVNVRSYNRNDEPSIYNNTRRYTYPLDEFKSQQWHHLNIDSEGVIPDKDYNPSFVQMRYDGDDSRNETQYLHAIYSLASDPTLARIRKHDKPMSKAEFDDTLKKANEYNDPVNKAKRDAKRKHDVKYTLLASKIIIYRLIHGLPISDETYEKTKLTSTFKM